MCAHHVLVPRAPPPGGVGASDPRSELQGRASHMGNELRSAAPQLSPLTPRKGAWPGPSRTWEGHSQQGAWSPGGAGPAVGAGSSGDAADRQTDRLWSEVVSLFLSSVLTWKMGSRAARVPWTLSLGRVSAAPSSLLPSTASDASPSFTARTATMSHPRQCPGPPRWPATCEALIPLWGFVVEVGVSQSVTYLVRKHKWWVLA